MIYESIRDRHFRSVDGTSAAVLPLSLQSGESASLIDQRDACSIECGCCIGAARSDRLKAGVELTLVLASMGEVAAMDRTKRLLDPVTEIECEALRVDRAVGLSP